MNDAVDRVLMERAALERGFGAPLLVSTFGHVMVVGGALLAAWLGARAPRIREVSGFAVVLPRGGGGPSNVEPKPAPAAAPPVPVTVPPAPVSKPEPPPKVLKPPKEEPRKGLPALDAKKVKAERTPPPAPASTGRNASASGGIPGLDIQGPAGLGVPEGDSASGDWYLAAVQRKIWTIWTRQVKPGFEQPITVSLTITETGAVEDVRVIESGGLAMLDTAAQRAVYSAAPFTALPRSYGTNRLTIRAVFRPGA